ncbi:hypothetical protein QDR37_02605 [Amnibacterium sp. CER49]|uniref:hypothetical protein n=1 Tax=Amnibacterium sp. CER49 TaxID=3039161 RepID=UPI002449FEB0|nr:hypothetical protein [Amnibacterium sp. CER49]MDH2442829.1 hypothetical protein [Amnibacterium sp. CER49]
MALALWHGARDEEQAARRVPPGVDAQDVRRRVRGLARAAGVRIRTSLLDGAVVAVRADASIWTDDLATMRAKLTPPE